MTLYLIRHGHTEGTEKKLYYGASDMLLSEAGKAEIAENREAGIYPSLDGKRLIASALTRTHQTLHIIYGDVPFEQSAAINEINVGDFEMKSHEELMLTCEYPLWLASFTMTQRYPNGESGADLRGRAVPYLESLMTGGDAIVICHGGVIGCSMQYWFGSEDDGFYQWPPAPSRGYAIECENGSPVSFTRL